MYLFMPAAYLDLKIMLSLQYMWYLELQKSDSDVRTVTQLRMHFCTIHGDQ